MQNDSGFDGSRRVAQKFHESYGVVFCPDNQIIFHVLVTVMAEDFSLCIGFAVGCQLPVATFRKS
jgi:hypothetical protein